MDPLIWLGQLLALRRAPTLPTFVAEELDPRPVPPTEVALKILGYEPAMILYSVNAAVALLVAYGFPLNGGQVAAISTIATAVLTLIVAVMTRPISVSALTGAVGTGLAAAAAFGLHLSADQIGTTVAALSIVLALVLRANVSPASGPVAEQPVVRIENYRGSGQ